MCVSRTVYGAAHAMNMDLLGEVFYVLGGSVDPSVSSDWMCVPRVNFRPVLTRLYFGGSAKPSRASWRASGHAMQLAATHLGMKLCE